MIKLNNTNLYKILFLFQMNLNALTDEGIETILKAASQNQTLTYLSLQVCGYMHLFNLNNEIFIEYASHIISMIFYTIFKNLCTHHAVISKNLTHLSLFFFVS